MILDLEKIDEIWQLPPEKPEETNIDAIILNAFIESLGEYIGCHIIIQG